MWLKVKHLHQLATSAVQHTNLSLILGEQLPTGQEVFITGKWNDWFWQLSEVKLQEGGYRVNISVAETRRGKKGGFSNLQESLPENSAVVPSKDWQACAVVPQGGFRNSPIGFIPRFWTFNVPVLFLKWNQHFCNFPILYFKILFKTQCPCSLLYRSVSPFLKIIPRDMMWLCIWICRDSHCIVFLPVCRRHKYA